MIMRRNLREWESSSPQTLTMCEYTFVYIRWFSYDDCWFFLYIYISVCPIVCCFSMTSRRAFTVLLISQRVSHTFFTPSCLNTSKRRGEEAENYRCSRLPITDEKIFFFNFFFHFITPKTHDVAIFFKFITAPAGSRENLVKSPN